MRMMEHLVPRGLLRGHLVRMLDLMQVQLQRA